MPEEIKFQKDVAIAASAETELMRFAQTGESAKPFRLATSSKQQGLVGGISSKYEEN